MSRFCVQRAVCRFALASACLLSPAESLRAQEVSASGPNPEHGLALAGWMFYPSFFGGAVFNDNVYLSARNRRAALGARLRPSLEAVLDNGIHKFSVRAFADAQIYPGLSGGQGFAQPSNTAIATYGATGPQNIQAGVAVNHVYRPLEDLTVNSSASFWRQIGLIGTNFGAQPANLLAPSVIPVQSGVPQFYNSFTVSTGVEKKVTERTFVRLRGGVSATLFDNPANPSSALVVASSAQSFVQPTGAGYSLVAQQNNVTYQVSARAGYWVNPLFNVFVEPSGYFYRYSNSLNDNNGVKGLVGVATEQIGLVKGEIYGGYNAQFGLDPRLGKIWAPSFGGRLYYTPTPYITLTASVDESMGGSAVPAVSPYSASPLVAASTPFIALTNVKVLQARLQADYALSPFWRASLRGGYGLFRYTDFGTKNTTLTAGFNLSYDLWRNFSLTLDYQFSTNDSSLQNSIGSLQPGTPALLSYTQNVVTAGVIYHY